MKPNVHRITECILDPQWMMATIFLSFMTLQTYAATPTEPSTVPPASPKPALIVVTSTPPLSPKPEDPNPDDDIPQEVTKTSKTGDPEASDEREGKTVKETPEPQAFVRLTPFTVDYLYKTLQQDTIGNPALKRNLIAQINEAYDAEEKYLASLRLFSETIFFGDPLDKKGVVKREDSPAILAFRAMRAGTLSIELDIKRLEDAKKGLMKAEDDLKSIRMQACSLHRAFFGSPQLPGTHDAVHKIIKERFPSPSLFPTLVPSPTDIEKESKEKTPVSPTLDSFSETLTRMQEALVSYTRAEECFILEYGKRDWQHTMSDREMVESLKPKSAPTRRIVYA